MGAALLAACAFALLPTPTLAQDVEEILSYDVDVDIQTDGQKDSPSA